MIERINMQDGENHGMKEETLKAINAELQKVRGLVPNPFLLSESGYGNPDAIMNAVDAKSAKQRATELVVMAIRFIEEA